MDAPPPPPSAPAPAPIDVVRVLSRGLSILRAFVPRNEWLGNHEIAQRCGLPKPTVSRLTARLVELGYLVHSAELGRYRLGPRVLELGYAAATERDFAALARPAMQRLANDEDALVVLSVRDDLSMVALGVCYSERSMLSLRVSVGTRLSLPFSALGRALVGAMEPAERAPLLEDVARRMPRDWPQLSAAFDDAARQMRGRGACANLGDLDQGVNGAAVTIDAPGAPHRYALGVAAPAFRFGRTQLERSAVPRLIALKRELESALAAGHEA